MNGGSLLAMAGKNCVALAVDKRFGSGPQLVNIAPLPAASGPRNNNNNNTQHKRSCCLCEELEAEVDAKRNRALGFSVDNNNDNDRSRISPPALACLTSHVLYQKRGYYVEPLVVGLREKLEGDGNSYNSYTPFLCAMDMIGAQSFSQSFVCSGAASTSLYGTAEAMWRPNMTPDELLECCGRVFQSALERDCLSGYGILVYLITKDGIAEYDLASRND
eukprot:jgi/Psemu1/68921/estExt_Genemark1.C_6340004